MCPSQDKDSKKDESLFDKRPPGILLGEKQWFFLKERYHMTPRELQVAILVCRGFNNDEIASALKIRHGTVKTHLRSLFRRVRVKSKILLLLRFIADVNRTSVSSKPGSAIPILEIGAKTEHISKTYHKKQLS